jgi:hypothetical protein
MASAENIRLTSTGYSVYTGHERVDMEPPGSRQDAEEQYFRDLSDASAAGPPTARGMAAIMARYATAPATEYSP